MSQRPRRRLWRFFPPMPEAVFAALRTIRGAFDLRDAFFFGGLLVAGYGGSMISLPWTLVAVGTALSLKGHGPFIVRRREP